MLVHLLRYWPNIKPTLGQHIFVLLRKGFLAGDDVLDSHIFILFISLVFTLLQLFKIRISLMM